MSAIERALDKRVAGAIPPAADGCSGRELDLLAFSDKTSAKRKFADMSADDVEEEGGDIKDDQSTGASRVRQRPIRNDRGRMQTSVKRKYELESNAYSRGRRQSSLVSPRLDEERTVPPKPYHLEPWKNLRGRSPKRKLSQPLPTLKLDRRNTVVHYSTQPIANTIGEDRASAEYVVTSNGTLPPALAQEPSEDERKNYCDGEIRLFDGDELNHGKEIDGEEKDKKPGRDIGKVSEPSNKRTLKSVAVARRPRSLDPSVFLNISPDKQGNEDTSAGEDDARPSYAAFDHTKPPHGAVDHGFRPVSPKPFTYDFKFGCEGGLEYGRSGEKHKTTPQRISDTPRVAHQIARLAGVGPGVVVGSKFNPGPALAPSRIPLTGSSVSARTPSWVVAKPAAVSAIEPAGFSRDKLVVLPGRTGKTQVVERGGVQVESATTPESRTPCSELEHALDKSDGPDSSKGS